VKVTAADIIAAGDARLPSRFWNKVKVDNDRGCWLWVGAITSHGYGNVSNGPKAGLRMVPAHRFSFAALIGPIPSGAVLDHLCEVKNCVNPFHLEPVTSAENTRRAASRITHCPKGHEYSGRNLIKRGNRRGCRICSYARAEAYRQRCLAAALESL
jgi:hypothetical protein